jgi:chorismate dehydratase
VGGLAALNGVVETVGKFGIAAEGKCMSVLFFSRIPFEAFTAPHTLQITGDTASSVRLLYLLLGHTHGFNRIPWRAVEGQTPDGELLIGDRALIRGQATVNDQDIFVTDLSERWSNIHGLPFVFARWVVRKDAPDAAKVSISRWLDTFKKVEPYLVEKAVSESSTTLGLSSDIIRRYFQVIRRSLDDRDLEGQKRFFDLLEKFGRSPLFGEILKKTQLPSEKDRMGLEVG